jgi:hypothetical protein
VGARINATIPTSEATKAANDLVDSIIGIADVDDDFDAPLTEAFADFFFRPFERDGIATRTSTCATALRVEARRSRDIKIAVMRLNTAQANGAFT